MPKRFFKSVAEDACLEVDYTITFRQFVKWFVYEYPYKETPTAFLLI